MKWVLLVCLLLVAAPGLEAGRGGRKVKYVHVNVKNPGKAKAIDVPASLSAKVMNGFATVSWTQFPYLAAFLSAAPTAQNVVYCTGILINNQWVLTAASCLTDGNAQQLNYYMPQSIALQFTDITAGPGLNLGVSTTSDLYWPATYKKTLDMDVGLVKLSSKVTGTASIASLAAVGYSATVPDGVSMAIAGAGVISSGFCNPRTNTSPTPCNPITPGLNNGNVIVAAVAYVKSGAVATTIRAGNVPTRSNMCAGDWGGPLIKWSPASQTVVGLYVSGPPCDLLGTDTPISYYTDVSNKNIRDFINGILAINGQPAV